MPNRMIKAAFALCLLFACAGFGLRAGAQVAGPDRRELAALRADVQVVNDSLRKMVAAMETLNEQNVQLKKQVDSLEKRLQQLSSEDAELRKQIVQLQNALVQEVKNREKMLDQVVNSVSTEVNRIVTTADKSGGAKNQGEYTVVRGDTLGAIARAFSVNIVELRKVNGLNGDLIREGQTLTIPAN